MLIPTHILQRATQWLRSHGLVAIVACLCAAAVMHSQGRMTLRSYLIEDVRRIPWQQQQQKPVAMRRSSSSSFSRPLHPAAAKAQSLPTVVGPQVGASVRWESGFPAFGRTVYPVSAVPNWGAMRTAAEWSRSFAQMRVEDFVPVPVYNLQKLLVAFRDLKNPRNDDEITRKLFYSTKHFAAYDLDAGEYTAVHPGVDLKLALGTPLGAIAGGRVHAVRTNPILGLHVIIEHRHPADGTFYSIYGHLGSARVSAGTGVQPGTVIGTVGLTGKTSGAHVHLQVDRGHGEATHNPYLPNSLPSPGEADRWTVHPIRFIERYAQGT